MDLNFARNRNQACRYEAVITSGGEEQTMRGRLTEMFVRRDGKWMHPGWHLDLAAGGADAR